MSRSNTYRNINNVGQNFYSEVSSPTTYCLNDTLSQKFLHGGISAIYGQNSQFCQRFWGEYCAEEWDDLCEVASKNTSTTFPNNTVFGSINNRPYNYKGLNAGETVIRNTAANKYLVAMGNCVPKYEPFDPLVADSPMIKKWVSSYNGQNNCVPVYGVNPEIIDYDVVMDKLLEKPTIALDILINIYNTHQRDGSYQMLLGTKIGQFFENNPAIFI